MEKRDNLYYPSKEFSQKAWVNNSAVYEEAKKDRVKFWEEKARELFWFEPWDKAFEHNAPYFKWFLNGKTNITSNIFENNQQGFENIKDKIAFIWESESIEEKEKTFTYSQLFTEVCRLSNALKSLGVKKGDRVGIYLPMVPEVLISLLACARIGAVHTVVFSAFSATALNARLNDSEAKVLITCDGYFRGGTVINLKNNADQGILGTKVEKMVVVKRAGNQVSWQEGRDLWFDELVKDMPSECAAEVMDAQDPLFILYTSGSTGKPKGCLHVNGGYMIQSYYTTKAIFDLKSEDIFWSTADIGWITGHTYSCYGPLLCGATFVIFEGLIVYPEPNRWAKIIDKYKVTIYYTAPTAIRMFEKYGTEALKNCKMDTLRLLGSVGEPIDESAWMWYFREVGKEKCPIVDTWWQTETGGILITSLPGLGPFKPSYAGLPLPGTNFEILDDKGKVCGPNQQGNLVLKAPFTPGLFRDIWQNQEKYKETYWSQYGPEIYFTSDGAFFNEQGLVRIVGRVDDVIKVAGHRVSTGEMENAVAKHENITECAVIGVADAIKGEVPLVFITYSGAEKTVDELKKEVVDQIKKEIGPIALPKEVYIVEDLPKTRSGKIMRRILKKLVLGEDLGDLSTLSNPESVDKIKQAIIK